MGVNQIVSGSSRDSQGITRLKVVGVFSVVFKNKLLISKALPVIKKQIIHYRCYLYKKNWNSYDDVQLVVITINDNEEEFRVSMVGEK